MKELKTAGAVERERERERERVSLSTWNLSTQQRNIYKINRKEEKSIKLFSNMYF